MIKTKRNLNNKKKNKSKNMRNKSYPSITQFQHCCPDMRSITLVHPMALEWAHECTSEEYNKNYKTREIKNNKIK
jgi:hypothetical protein